MKTIIGFDLETTGTDISKDRIVSISLIKFLFPSFEIKEKKYLILNPTIHIEEGASKVHGFTDEMVKNKRTFKQYSEIIFNYINDCDYLLTHNGKKFDRSLLYEEFKRYNLEWNPKPIIDTYVIMSNMIPRTLEGALRYYCNKEIIGAHNAEEDVLSTIEVLKGQIDRHGFEDDVEKINSYSEVELHELLEIKSKYENEDKYLSFDGKIILSEFGPQWNFGKHKGKSIFLDENYYNWFLSADFPQQTKNVLISLLNNK